MWIDICLQTEWAYSHTILVSFSQACLLFVRKADKWIKYLNSGSPERAKRVDTGVCPLHGFLGNGFQWITETANGQLLWLGGKKDGVVRKSSG